MKVKSESEAAQSCLTLCDPMDCSLPGSCVHGIFQARVLEWDAIAFSVLTNSDAHNILIDDLKKKPANFYLHYAHILKNKNKQNKFLSDCVYIHTGNEIQ